MTQQASIIAAGGLAVLLLGSRIVHVYRESGVWKVGQRPFRPEEAT